MGELWGVYELRCRRCGKSGALSVWERDGAVTGCAVDGFVEDCLAGADTQLWELSCIRCGGVEVTIQRVEGGPVDGASRAEPRFGLPASRSLDCACCKPGLRPACVYLAG